MREQPTEQDLLQLAHHETGHVAVAFYLGRSLATYHLWLDRKTGKGAFHFRSYDEPLASRDSIMRLLGGPVAEYLFYGKISEKAIRFSHEYRNPNSDSSRIRAVLRAMTGMDDKVFQFELQQCVYTILREPRTWAAVQDIARALAAEGELAGEAAERIFLKHNAPTQFAPEGAATAVQTLAKVEAERAAASAEVRSHPPRPRGKVPVRINWKKSAAHYPRKGQPGILYRKDIAAALIPEAIIEALLFYGPDGTLAGIANYYPYGVLAEPVGSCNVIVAPKCRRQGIGTQLLREALNRWHFDVLEQRYSAAGAKLVQHLLHGRGVEKAAASVKARAKGKGA